MTTSRGTLRYLSVLMSALLAISLLSFAPAAKASTVPAVESVIGWNNPVGRGFTVFLTVVFSETVAVTGVPKVNFQIGEQTRVANFFRVRSGRFVDFSYLVTAEDRNGLVFADSIDLNGGLIASNPGGVAADLAIPVGQNVMDTSTPTIEDQGPKLLDATVNGKLITLNWDEYIVGFTGDIDFGHHVLADGVRVNESHGYFPDTNPVTFYPGWSPFVGPDVSFKSLSSAVAPGAKVEHVAGTSGPMEVSDGYWNPSDLPARFDLRNITPIPTKPHLGKSARLHQLRCAGSTDLTFVGETGGTAYYFATSSTIATICGFQLSSGTLLTSKEVPTGAFGPTPNFVRLLGDRIWFAVDDGLDVPSPIFEYDLADTFTQITLGTDFVTDASCVDALLVASEVFVYCMAETSHRVHRFSLTSRSWTNFVFLGSVSNTLFFEWLGVSGGKAWLGDYAGPTRAIDIATNTVSSHNAGQRLSKLVEADSKTFALSLGTMLFGRVLKPMAQFNPVNSSFANNVDIPGEPLELVSDGTNIFAISTAIPLSDIAFLTKLDSDLNRVWSVPIPDMTHIISLKSDSILLGDGADVLEVSTVGALFDSVAGAVTETSLGVQVSLDTLGNVGEVEIAVSRTAGFENFTRVGLQSASGDIRRDYTFTANELQRATDYYIAPIFKEGDRESFGYPIRVRTAGVALGGGGSGGGGSGGGGGGGGGGFFPAPATPAEPVSVNPLTTTARFAVLGEDGKPIEVTRANSVDRRQMTLSFGEAVLTLEAPVGSSFSESGRLAAPSGSKVQVIAAGFQPDTLVTGYLVPIASLTTSLFSSQNTAPITLGTKTVDQNGSFSFEADLGSTTGSYLVQLSGTKLGGAKTDILFEAEVRDVDALKTWAKRMVGNTQAKLYAKSIVGVGKVSFRVNGREIAWVNAKDLSDRKLRKVGADNYLVRTINLVKGKNVLEVFVDGKRTTRTVYSRK